MCRLINKFNLNVAVTKGGFTRNLKLLRKYVCVKLCIVPFLFSVKLIVHNVYPLLHLQHNLAYFSCKWELPVPSIFIYITFNKHSIHK